MCIIIIIIQCIITMELIWQGSVDIVLTSIQAVGLLNFTLSLCRAWRLFNVCMVSV